MAHNIDMLHNVQKKNITMSNASNRNLHTIGSEKDEMSQRRIAHIIWGFDLHLVVTPRR